MNIEVDRRKGEKAAGGRCAEMEVRGASILIECGGGARGDRQHGHDRGAAAHQAAWHHGRSGQAVDVPAAQPWTAVRREPQEKVGPAMAISTRVRPPLIGEARAIST
jgi:hypothetical protein